MQTSQTHSNKKLKQTSAAPAGIKLGVVGSHVLITRPQRQKCRKLQTFSRILGIPGPIV